MTAADTASRVTVVTVTFNSAEVLEGMLSSVPDRTPVVIVDNASADRDRLRAVASRRSAATQLVENTENIGFGRACNRGAEQADTDFLLFLNPDAALAPDALQKLVEAAERFPDAGGFNPCIQDESGRAVLKRRSDLVARDRWLPRGALADGSELPVLSGAALFTRRRDFERIGGFDPEIFLFFEDDDLSLRLATECGKLMYVANSVVTHLGGASSGGSEESERLKNWHWGYAQVYVMRKHGFGRSCVLAFAKTILRTLSPATLISGKRRRKYVNRLSGMITALRRTRSQG